MSGVWHQLIFIALILAGFPATIWSQARILPFQNVLSAAAIIALISGFAEVLDLKTGMPFGRFFYTADAGVLLFRLLPWPIPLLWVIMILNSRGMARLILRPWRKTSRYGYWTIGLTCLLTMIFDASVEPYASHANHFWIWLTFAGTLSWYGAPWINFLGVGVVTLLILAFATPWLINKKISAKSQADYAPLTIWLLFALLMNLSSAAKGLWLAAAFGVASSLMAAILAWRNSRW